MILSKISMARAGIVTLLITSAVFISEQSYAEDVDILIDIECAPGDSLSFSPVGPGTIAAVVGGVEVSDSIVLNVTPGMKASDCSTDHGKVTLTSAPTGFFDANVTARYECDGISIDESQDCGDGSATPQEIDVFILAATGANPIQTNLKVVLTLSSSD
jgi:hypothetical protein